jgi:hypothetical protein
MRVRLPLFFTLALLLVTTSSFFIEPAHAEPTLQQIFDDNLGEGCVDATTDNGNETFPAGTYRFTYLAAYTDFIGTLAWAPIGDSKAFNVLFDYYDSPGAVETVAIPVPFVIRYQSYNLWSSDNTENGDAYDHFVAYARCGAAGSIAAGFEDVYGGGDGDHNDFVFSMEPATKQVVTFNYTTKVPRTVVTGPGAARSLKGTFVPLGTGPGVLSAGDLHIEVIDNPPGCGEPTVTVDGFDFEIVWPDACFDYGETVSICLKTDKGPLEVDEAGLYDSKDEYIIKPKAEEGPPIPLCGSETTLDCSGAFAGRATLWPPNHAMVPVFISGVTSTGDDPITITVTGITQDEPLNGTGDGDTCPDGSVDDGLAYVRAERAGGGNGRVYVVSFHATDGSASCDGSVTVSVPHDRKSTAVDDGQTTNSMGECSEGGGAVISRMMVPGLSLDVTDRTVNIHYSVPTVANVSLGVYDVTGRRVGTIVEGSQSQGEHQLSWNAGHLSSGVYFCRLLAGEQSVTRTLLIKR